MLEGPKSCLSLRSVVAGSSAVAHDDD